MPNWVFQSLSRVLLFGFYLREPLLCKGILLDNRTTGKDVLKLEKGYFCRMRLRFPTQVAIAKGLHSLEMLATKLLIVLALVVFTLGLFTPSFAKVALPSASILQASSFFQDSIATSGRSTSRVRIHGFVINRDNEPISFANIKIKGEAVGTSSNLKGAYSFTISKRADSLTIEYSCIGYKTVSKHFPTGLSADLRLNVVLPDADVEIAAVTVTGTSRKAQNMEQIKAENIRVMGAPTGGVEAMVGTYAGVSQTNELSSQYSVRGGSYDENMVYVNGMEVFRPLLVRQAQQEGLSFVQPEMIQSINFSAGGFTAEYGDKMSSVLDIRYRRPSAFEASVGVGLQSDHLYLGAKRGPFSIISGARFKDGRNLLAGLDTKGEYRPLYFDAQTYAQYDISPRWQLSFLGNMSLTHYSFIPQTRETSYGTLANMKKLKVYFDGRERDRFLSFYGNLSLAFLQNERLRHTLSFVGFRSNEEETYDIEGAYYLGELQGEESSQQPSGASLSALATGSNLEHARNRLNYSVLTGAYRLTYSLSDQHTFKLGLDVRGEWVNDRISEWALRDSAGYNQPHHEDRVEMLYNLYSDNRLSAVRLSGHLLDQMTFDTKAGKWQLYPGIRVSYYSFTRELIASPRMVAAFTPEKASNLTLRGAAGLYYQAPFYKELRRIQKDAAGNNIVGLNKEIRSQGSVHVLLGGDYSFQHNDRNFRFTAEAYYKYLFNLNPYRVENVKIRYLGENVGNGYIMGVDFKFFGEFVPDVDSWITFSLLKSKEILPGIGTMPLPNAPWYNFSLFFQDYFPGFERIRLSLRGVLSGGLPQFKPSASFDPPIFTGAPYTRVDLGLIYRVFDKETARPGSFFSWLKHFDVAVELFNLFDNANVSGYYWVTDANNRNFAVPNYLTRRQLNIRFVADF